MDCINSFRIFFLRKKTFNLIWEKIRTFEVLCISSLKKFSSGSLLSSVSETFSLWKGLKFKFSKFSNEHEFEAIIIIYSFLRSKKKNHPNTH